MRDYGKVAPTFWTGETGIALRKLGPHYQLAALYFMTAPNSNMIGIFPLVMPAFCLYLNISLKKAKNIISELERAEFCRVDEKLELIFVRTMAARQLGKTIKANDNKVKWVEKLLASCGKSFLVKEFYQEYGEKYNLPGRHIYEGALEVGSEAPSKSGDGDGDGDGDGYSPLPPEGEAEDLKSDSSNDTSDTDDWNFTPPPPKRVRTFQPSPFPDELDVFEFKQFWEATWLPYLVEKSRFGRAPPLATILEQLKQLVEVVRADPHRNPQAAIANLKLAISRNLYGPITPKEAPKQESGKRDLLAELAETDP